MATRQESVRLSLKDDFTSGMARATAATALFKRELSDLDGKRVRTDLDHISEAVNEIGASSRKSGPDIDRLSGRLRLITDAAIAFGPAAVRLGAAAIPVLTASLVGLGAAAGGIGVAVLALNGMGDALKAMQTYELEPTAENLQAMRIELEKLGPAGRDFARYIEGLEPVLRDLQMTAREGLLPGVEEGIDGLLQRLPQIRNIVSELSEGMGNLARSAGESLGGDEWNNFFDYMETDARPTLEAFGQAAGNVALGVANLLTGFAPATRDFTSGLVSATEAFADWSAGLETNEGFQSFVDYVRQAGPEAVDFLAAMAKAVAGLLEAAAPIGAVVLPALTGVVEIFAAIAGSPIGPVLYTAAAGLVAFNRAAAISSGVSAKLTGSMTGLSAASKAQAGALGVGIAIPVVVSLTSAYEDMAVAIDDAEAALRSGDMTAILEEQARLIGMIAEGHPEEGTVGNWWDAFKGSYQDFTGATADAQRRLDEIAGAMRNSGGLADLFGETIGQTGDQMRVAANDAQTLSSAMSQLNGWFDKRDAVRGYKDNIDALRESLKDGFTRDDVANIDQIGRSIVQVAEKMSSPVKRTNFLAEARNQMNVLAKESGPKAREAIQEVISKLDEVGLTHAKPKITADDQRAEQSIDRVRNNLKVMGQSITKPQIDADDNPFKQTYGSVKKSMREADALRADPTVRVDAGNSLGILGQLRSLLDNINGRVSTATVRVNRIGGSTSSAGGQSVPVSADGGTVPKTGKRYADRHLYLLADGEEVVSNRNGQADRYRTLLKAINNNQRLAAGGTAGTYTSRYGSGGGAFQEASLNGVSQAADATSRTLKSLNASLNKHEKALDRETSALESLTSQRDSLSSAASSSLLHDPFGNGLAGLQAQVAADTADSRAMLAALQTLVRNGLDPKGSLFQSLAASGDVTTAQQLAQLSSADLFATQAQFADRSAVSAQVGGFAGNQAFGAAIDKQAKVTDELRAEVKHLRQAVNAMEKAAKDMPDKAGAGVFQATKDAHDGRNTRTAGFAATNAKSLNRR